MEKERKEKRKKKGKERNRKVMKTGNNYKKLFKGECFWIKCQEHDEMA